MMSASLALSSSGLRAITSSVRKSIFLFIPVVDVAGFCAVGAAAAVAAPLSPLAPLAAGGVFEAAAAPGFLAADALLSGEVFPLRFES